MLINGVPKKFVGHFVQQAECLFNTSYSNSFVGPIFVGPINEYVRTFAS